MNTFRETFLANTIKQLKGGMECYVFDMETAKEIEKRYFEKTNLKIEIEKIDDNYILLKPKDKITKRIY